MDYVILGHFKMLDLEELVKEYMKKGYWPTGGVSVVPTNQDDENLKQYYIQAMTLTKYSGGKIEYSIEKLSK